MGAKHSKNADTKHPRYGLLRPQKVCPTLPIVVVVCDDVKTAVAYFNELKREVKRKVTLDVIPAYRHGATPNEVVDLAVKKAKGYQGDASHDLKDTEESVWALIDLEGDQNRQNDVQNAKNKGENKGINVALSKPCFEVWTLAHFVDTGKHFNDCNAVLDNVATEWKKNLNIHFDKKQKANNDYGKLMPLRNEALKSARKRNPKTDPSWTEVWQVIDDIEKHVTS